jgi:uncharacterized protein YbjT (DUF2867 family)
MKTLIIGGTGTVGSQVANELLTKKQHVRVLTTSSEKAAALPQDIEASVGNLDQAESLTKAFDGIDRVFMISLIGHNEVEQAKNAIAAAKQASVSKIVFQSIYHAHDLQVIPHVATKVAIEKAIQASGINYTFVCPNNFFQNDFWYQQAITQYGIYPQPIGDIGLSRNDVRDIAEVAAKALLASELDGLSIPIVGPEVLNGSAIARQLTEQLGYQVIYGGNDLEAWAVESAKYLPAWLVDELKLMYAYIQKNGVTANKEEVSMLTKILGRAPRSYASFLRDHKSLFQREAAVV